MQDYNRRMTIRKFDTIAWRVFRSIPKKFRRHLRNVMLIIEDKASDELLKKMKISHNNSLYGLYEGIPLLERNVGDALWFPDRITIFRKPLMDDYGYDEHLLARQIRLTILHEVGHHFGLNDQEMEEYES